MRRTNADVSGLLTALQDAGVVFCVIGGVAAIAHGVLTPTQDLDIAAPMTADNLARSPRSRHIIPNTPPVPISE